MATRGILGTGGDIRLGVDIDVDNALNKLDRLKRAAREMGYEGSQASVILSGPVRQWAEQTDRAREGTKKASDALSSFGHIAYGVASRLVGPIGIASAITYVANSMIELSKSRVQLQLLADDAWVSAQQFTTLEYALRRTGLTSDQARTQLGNILNTLHDVKSFEFSSQAFKTLQEMNLPGAFEGFNSVLESMRKNDIPNAIKAIADAMKNHGPAWKENFARAFGTTASVLENMVKNLSDVKKEIALSDPDSQKAWKSWNDFKERLENVWDELLTNLVKASQGKLEPIITSFKSLSLLLKGEFGEALRNELGVPAAKQNLPKPNIPSDTPLIDWLENWWKGTKQGELGEAFKNEFGLWKGTKKQGALEDSGSTELMARQHLAQEELNRTEEDSNRVLREIRDILDITFSETPTPPGTGYGGGNGYGSVFGPNSSGVPGIMGDLPTSTNLAEQRKKFAEELEQKPWLREKILGIAAGENKDPRANLAVIESMLNRAIVRGTTLEAQARLYGRERGGYYAGYDPGSLNRPRIRTMIEENLRKALAGSNISNYATDNASGGLAAREAATLKFVPTVRPIAGETFFRPNWGEPNWRNRWFAWHNSMLAGASRDSLIAPGPSFSPQERMNRTLEEMLNKNIGPISQNRNGVVPSADMGSATINVNVNAPAGTKVDVDSSGVFKVLKVTRQPQGAKAGVLPFEGDNAWYYE